MKDLLAPDALRPPPPNPQGLAALPIPANLFPQIHMNLPLRRGVHEFLNPLFLLLKAAVMTLTPASAGFLTVDQTGKVGHYSTTHCRVLLFDSMGGERTE